MGIYRSFILIMCFILFGTASVFTGSVVFPLISFFNRNEQKKLDIYSAVVYKSWHFFVRFMEFIKVFKINTNDINKLKSIKNSLIVSTHPSYLDVLIILALIPKTTCYVAPRLAKNKFFNKIVKSMFLISGKSLEELKKDSNYMFEHGFNILIFPSGIRHRKNEHPKIRKGSAMIALNSKRDIIPLIMNTDRDFLQIGQPLYDAGIKPVIYDIKCGEVIKINDYLNYDDEVLQRKILTERIKNSLQGDYFSP